MPAKRKKQGPKKARQQPRKPDFTGFCAPQAPRAATALPPSATALHATQRLILQALSGITFFRSPPLPHHPPAAYRRSASISQYSEALLPVASPGHWRRAAPWGHGTHPGARGRKAQGVRGERCAGLWPIGGAAHLSVQRGAAPCGRYPAVQGRCRVKKGPLRVQGPFCTLGSGAAQRVVPTRGTAAMRRLV